MALTVFTDADQKVGPLRITRDGQWISISVQGDMSRGSIVTFERAWGAETSYRAIQTFTGTGTREADYQCAKGWNYQIRCSTFVASDAPSAEIIG